MIEELDLVVLTRDVPASGLRVGDIGTVVHKYPEGVAFEVEFMTADGNTIDVLTLEREDVRPRRAHEILHAREVA